MKKLVVTLGAAVLGLCGAIAPASAQNTANGQLLGGGMMSKFSAADVASMLSDIQVQSTLVEYEGGSIATMLAETSGGARFIVSMMVCDNIATATGCQRALVFTATSNAGFAYEDLNEFNLNADITKAANLASENIIMFGAPIFTAGGIGRENFKLLIAIFLNDMNNFVQSQNSSAANVAFQPGLKTGGKLDNIGAGRETTPEKTQPFSASITEHALSAAVANTWKVKFLTDEAKAALE